MYYDEPMWIDKRNSRPYMAGDYVKFTIVNDEPRTTPHGLVNRNFPLAKYIDDCDGFIIEKHLADIGDARLLPSICRIDKIVSDKNNDNYPIVTPICPYEIFDQAKFLQITKTMNRIEQYAIANDITVYIGDFTWDDKTLQDNDYANALRIVLKGGLNIHQLKTALETPATIPGEPVKVITPMDSERFKIGNANHTYTVYYLDSTEVATISFPELRKLAQTNRLTNRRVTVRDGYASINLG